ncbi:MAG: hypothetical protein ACYSUC_06855 [Planctomycetota bacterium]|jgi:hypothetical protein
MKQNLKNLGLNVAAGRFGPSSAQKKKTIIALCLIAIMALMWARLLGRETPKNAKAASTPAAAGLDTSGANLESRMTFQELPKVKGRNDVLARDFFGSDNWKHFLRDSEGYTEKVSVVSKDGDEEVVKRIADKLELQAIWLDQNTQAFINDKMLSVGDKLTVREGIKTYECEVAGIQESRVFIRCEGAQIILKLTQAGRVGD